MESCLVTTAPGNHAALARLAALHLSLQAVRSDLRAAVASQNHFSDQAAVCRALAAEQENPRNREPYYRSETQMRMQANGMAKQVAELVVQVAAIAAEIEELQGEPEQVERVAEVLS